MARSRSRCILAAVLATPLAACAGAQYPEQRADDTMLTADVENRLAVDTDASSFDVDVDTIDGIVTLRGEVESETEKTVTENIARNTLGVRGVRNLLVVKDHTMGEGMDEGMSDAAVHTRVGQRLRLDPDARSSRIDVDVDNGIVTLSGTVDSVHERAAAEDIASRTKGVRGVVNELEVIP